MERTNIASYTWSTADTCTGGLSPIVLIPQYLQKVAHIFVDIDQIILHYRFKEMSGKPWIPTPQERDIPFRLSFGDLACATLCLKILTGIPRKETMAPAQAYTLWSQKLQPFNFYNNFVKAPSLKWVLT